MTLTRQSDPQWMIFFEDHDIRPEIFDDEAAARQRYKDCLLNWSCHLFVSERALQSAQAALAELVRLKDLQDTFPALLKDVDQYGYSMSFQKAHNEYHDHADAAWETARALASPKGEQQTHTGDKP